MSQPNEQRTRIRMHGFFDDRDPTPLDIKKAWQRMDVWPNTTQSLAGKAVLVALKEESDESV